ncbi:hypothetical protein [Enterococcus hailinensis]|uniref:hypothetical protein n=1 Tax=Enterococcus hailinensis TaxID=3238988 RepID=UPI0038B2B0C8
MDNKESLLIDQCLGSFYENIFVETDVYLLLILLRQHSKKSSIVFELANFVAHRERDRGNVHKYIFETKLKVEKIGTENTQIKISTMFDEHKLLKDINSILFELEKQTLSVEIADDLMLCVISLLQGVKLIKNNRVIGELKVSVSPTFFQLIGTIKPHGGKFKDKNIDIVFPVLRTKNDWLKVIKRETIFKHTMLTFRGYDGKLLIKLDENNPI